MATNSATFANHATLSTTTADLNVFVSVQVITLSSFGGTDSFKVEYRGGKTASFVRGTNATSAAMQTALRTLTGDSNLAVSGNTDAGPFTVTFVDQPGPKYTLGVPPDDASGCTGATVNLNPTGKTLRVTNHDSSVDMYFNVNTATVPTGAADDTYYVAPGTSVTIVPGGHILKCRVVGNGNVYSAEII